ncbi:hypothetical protein F5B20DRAFT_466739 [Whalleya microplaca]|nr:hypothetical protein F5B20DRAFT_466739 [Whalleya microplaca]
MNFLDPYNAELDFARKYDFVTEMAPGVWKIYRKTDKIEYLAHDITDKLNKESDSDGVQGGLTELHELLHNSGPALIHPMMSVLNHEHLVSMVDMFGVQKTPAGGLPHTCTYAIWEYCDAGNLGNLLIKEQPQPDKETVKGEGDDGDGDKHMVDIGAVEKEAFLPESFCWHVLLSILKALAWLHDGTRYIVYDDKAETWDMLPRDPHWRTMLHRNVTPTNIFLGHPKRNESYGACKLGNYGDLVITGHFHGDLDQNIMVSRGKALAPPQGKKFQRLAELIKLDRKYGYSYPQKPDQPYTVVSEWRALGEIMQAMMVKPTTDDHLAAVRTRRVHVNLENTDYSAELKNTVLALMTNNPDTKQSNGERLWPHAEYLTSELVLYANRSFVAWRASGSPEAKNMILVDNALAVQNEEDARFHVLGQLSVMAVGEILDRQDKKYGDEPRGAKKF